MNKLTQEQFIEKAKLIHGDKYSYDFVDYINSKTKVIILCNSCSTCFKTIPGNFLLGKGCNICAIKYRGNIKKLKSESVFIDKATNIHGSKYIYNLVEYKSAKSTVKIICTSCSATFEQSPDAHLAGKGCNKCANNILMTKEEFIQKSNKFHENFYNYDLVEYKGIANKVKIICPIHDIFEQTPSNHFKHGCSKCFSSLGESQIRIFLKLNCINFIEQKRFNGCKNKNTLPFDFYLPDYNMCIEYDGEGHYKVINRSKDPIKNLKKFITTGLNDIIKDTFCIEEGIKLLRIPYFKFKEIDDILSKKLLVDIN